MTTWLLSLQTSSPFRNSDDLVGTQTLPSLCLHLHPAQLLTPTVIRPVVSPSCPALNTNRHSTPRVTPRGSARRIPLVHFSTHSIPLAYLSRGKGRFCTAESTQRPITMTASEPTTPARKFVHVSSLALSDTSPRRITYGRHIDLASVPWETLR